MEERDSEFPLTREGLLKALLAWYARPKVWEREVSQAPYSSGASSRAIRDSGQIARSALAANGVGGLLKVLCDAHEIPLTALGRKADVPDTRIAEIARGSDPSLVESRRLSRALFGMIQR